MKTFNEIKNNISKENLTKNKINLKIFLMILGKIAFSETSVVTITTIPFILGWSFFNFDLKIGLIYVVVHFLFYSLYLKKQYKKEFQPSIDEMKLTIKALKEIKSEK